MSDFIDRLGALLQKLSWNKIFQLFVLILILDLGWGYYKMSDQILDYIKRDKIESRHPSIKQLSESTIKEINSQASKSPIVAGVSVSMMNFQRNTKYIIYMNAYSSELDTAFSKYNILNLELPAFTQNPTQNSRLVDLINGEFVCDEYTSAGLASEMPGTAGIIAATCATGIPPYYGKFVGSVNIYLKRKPLPEEFDQLRVLAKNLSSIVYTKELK